MVAQHALKPQHCIFTPSANIISICSVILYFVNYLTWIMVECQQKDRFCSAYIANTSGQRYSVGHEKKNRKVIPLLHPCRKTPDSTNGFFNWFCLGSIMALRQKTAWRYFGQIAGPNLIFHTISSSVSNMVNSYSVGRAMLCDYTALWRLKQPTA